MATASATEKFSAASTSGGEPHGTLQLVSFELAGEV